MSTPSLPEFWLRGPVPGVQPLLQPVAHALLQAREEAARAAEGLTPEQVWLRPAGVAPVGFHLRHIAGVLDRLLTYARGQALDPEQLAALRREGDPGDPAEEAAVLIERMEAAVEHALEQVRGTPEGALLGERKVGRAGLPSTVLGLLFHAAEHAQRHTGQLIVTARVVRGDGSPGLG